MILFRLGPRREQTCAHECVNKVKNCLNSLKKQQTTQVTAITSEAERRQRTYK